MKLPLILLSGFVVVLLGTALINFLIIKNTGSPVAVPETPRGAEQYDNSGSSETGIPLTYALLGDSTTVSQGGDYDKGYARGTARYLASQGYAVTFYNFGVSGARAADIAESQAPQAAKVRPDIVLISVAANDVTHLTAIKDIEASLQSSINTLRAARPEVKIVLTGSAQMGSIPRFPQPTRLIAKLRVAQINNMVRQLVAREDVTFAPIADKTGPIFAARADELYASDKFHPNTIGYEVWTPVLNDALGAALAKTD